MAHEKLQRRRLLQPLDGKEAQATIEKAVHEAIEGNGLFRRNLVYPNFHFVFTLECRSFPNVPENFGVEVEQVHRTEDFVDDPLAEPEEITIEGGEDIKAPDAQREKLIQTGEASRTIATPEPEGNPDSDSFMPRGGRVVRVKKNDAAEEFDFDAERF